MFVVSTLYPYSHMIFYAVSINRPSIDLVVYDLGPLSPGNIRLCLILRFAACTAAASLISRYILFIVCALTSILAVTL